MKHLFMKHLLYAGGLALLTFLNGQAQVLPGNTTSGSQDTLSTTSSDSAKTIQGRIIDAANRPLPGVFVSSNDSTITTRTDSLGEFQLPYEAEIDTLRLSKPGYNARKVAVLGRLMITTFLTGGPPVPQAAATDSLTALGQDTAATSQGAVVQGDSAQAAVTGTGARGEIRGNVSAKQEGPLPGVNVVIKGSTRGTNTDAQGNYALVPLSPTDTLVFSLIGYPTREVPLANQTQINLVWEENAGQVLKEVVVIGYGTMDRKTLTSSVSSIGKREIENEPMPSITQAIQGKAGGVQVTQRGGSPGGGVSIRVRGTTSINASSEPLYVVDGIPVNSTTNFVGGSDYNLGGGTQGINILASINPSDIESVEILKDAAATAIYGSRAANGVVLITTRRGDANNSTISVNAYAGVSEVPRNRRYDMMNTQEYISYMQDYYRYAGTPIPASVTSTAADVNWQDQIFRTAPIQNYELSARGGSDKTQYFASVGYYNQQGTILNSGFSRISSRINLDHQHSDKLKLTANVNLTRAINNRIQEENSNQGATKNGISSPPNIPVRNPDGSWAFDPINTRRENPVAFLTLAKNDAETFRILGNVSAEYFFTPSLSFRSNWGADMSYINEDFFMPPRFIRNFAATGGLGSSRVSRDQLWINENMLTFDKQLESHHFNVLGGFSFQESKFTFTEARRNNFSSNDIPVISAGGTIAAASAGIEEWAIASYFGRLNYSFKDKYLFTANYRIDGSSRFGSNRRYGNFPSFAAAWRISQEEFLMQSNLISNLKLRASWGITGNQSIPNYVARSVYGGGANYINNPGFVPGNLGDSNLGWETTRQTDIGLDLGLFNDRITILADYYIKNTSDLLINVQIPRTSGFQTAFKNIGEIQNQGFEFELTTNNLVGAFRWTTSLNMTFNRNKVLSLPEGDLFGGTGNVSLAREGQPLGIFYGWEMVGVNPETGMIDFAKRDGTVGAPTDPLDRKIIGDPNPLFFGGITNNFNYKGFDLSIMGQFVYGNDVFNYQLAEISDGFNASSNGLSDWTRRWRNPGDITDMPRPTPGSFDNAAISTRWVQDGSFFRFRNVTLGYTFPQSMMEKIGVKNLRIYGTIQNALLFTKYRGYDPEVATQAGSNLGLVYGFDYGSYPQPRIFTGGINLSF
ncbi:TonB-dependent receptor [Rhabdobacter roseus]|uniref:TonB-linked SusC/RagA family outer membrane protein n=1 Tax=Rhabdobacter roseus TaxID=1655419 RepID=A0A840TRY9_9BACT|nr:SusC/RagA family TonB-linked outer membrane protein [Rhabdobacter roseus]MBB5284477.1 TonB-linked SusC/RagA family outer membrane protein [Rhabdobacter roseus]